MIDHDGLWAIRPAINGGRTWICGRYRDELAEVIMIAGRSA